MTETFVTSCLAALLAFVLTSQVLVAFAWFRTLRRHAEDLAALRKVIRTYERLRAGSAQADHVLVRRCTGTDTTWVDLVMTMPELSVRCPIEPDEMDGFIELLRDASRAS